MGIDLRTRSHAFEKIVKDNDYRGVWATIDEPMRRAFLNDFVNVPQTPFTFQVPNPYRQPSQNFSQDCVSAIDGTHIPCTPIGVSNPMAYRNRKGVNSQNILTACSFDMKFMYLLSGWEGSAHDERVLTDALSNPRFKFPRPPPGNYYLVDAAYVNNDCFLTPYRGETYYLPDYRRSSDGFQGARAIFNYKDSFKRLASRVVNCFNCSRSASNSLLSFASSEQQSERNITI
ncbi:uncharacterized protein LOC112092117 [Morus notabilis]|uniref:uncharacterized protein LOC112092117 n=1 Tax=Morus notabilis TaxID=981085 RepID=UPI000CED06FA|nr:uncharacterized protein LOC112092117 [Morus notabilis]